MIQIQMQTFYSYVTYPAKSSCNGTILVGTDGTVTVAEDDTDDGPEEAAKIKFIKFYKICKIDA